ncbi:MAG: TonB-dependent receptor [Caulobacterales bacterium 68-7]|nr:MAG: TonB-dependent receptor [Caulobacterales bacterium 68-7]
MNTFLKPAALRAALLTGAAMLAVAPALAHAADAADAASDAADSLEEVVVTAQKRATNLQDTPIAISVLGQEALEARHVQSLADLGDGAIPSLRVAPFFARSSALTLGVRGIGASGDANQPARDQAVGVYINGVYLGRAQGLGSALYDLERIEVLKGPQGTLFGRNTMGGAISIVTRRPSGEFKMNALAGVGNFGSYRAEAHADLPEINGLSLKLDGVISKRDGTVSNPAAGQPGFNSYDKHGFQIEALYQPTDAFTVDYAYDNSYDATTPYLVQLLKPGALPLAPINPPQPDRAETARIGVPLRLSEGKTSGHRLNLEWQANDWLQVKSITAYRDLDQTQYDNGSVALSVYAPNGAFARYSVANVYQHQFSQELQLIGDLDQVQFAAGAFYYDEHVRDNAQTPNSLRWNADGTAYSQIPLDFATVPFDRASHAETKSYGVFGQATWTPASITALHLTAGGRFTHDERTGHLDTVNGALPSYVNSAGQTIVGIIPLDAAWDHFDPMVDVAYDLSDDVNVYAKWSTGYKAGGANSRSLTYRAFDPETVSMYELGAKSEFWERRARLNVAAYYGDIKDIQVDFNAIIPGNNRGTLETTNAASGKTKGFEADFQIAPVDGLTLGLNYAYTKVTYSKAFNPFTGAQSTVNPLYTPQNAVSGTFDYSHPFFGATLKTHLDANWAEAQFTSTSDPTKSDESFIVNGRLALVDLPASEGASLEVALWARNLLDESYVFLRNTNASLGTYGIYNEPRTYGLEARVRF